MRLSNFEEARTTSEHESKEVMQEFKSMMKSWEVERREQRCGDNIPQVRGMDEV